MQKNVLQRILFIKIPEKILQSLRYPDEAYLTRFERVYSYLSNKYKEIVKVIKCEL
jgi:hypothetical protein